jgi:hypothetical protein
MTEQKLKLTSKEVEKLINNRLNTERFEEVFNDIPMYHPDHVMQKGETHRSYIEDDQREYRWYIFKDTVTGVEHCINYTYHPEWPNDLMDTPDSIEIVANDEDSDIYIKPVPVVEPEKILTPEAQADKDLWAKYQAMKHECRNVEPKERLKVPKARIDEILNLMKTKTYNIYQLRAVIVPVCIEYKLEDVTFWRWIQSKAFK